MKILIDFLSATIMGLVGKT